VLAEVRAAADEDEDDDDEEAPFEERLAASYAKLLNHAKVL
jgi:hypothetical protein